VDEFKPVPIRSAVSVTELERLDIRVGRILLVHHRLGR